MEKILFKRPCIYKGHQISQITIEYPYYNYAYYTVSAFIDGVLISVYYDRFPRDSKKTIMNKLIQKFERNA